MSIVSSLLLILTIFLTVDEKIPSLHEYVVCVFYTVCFADLVFIAVKRFHDLNKSWLHLFTLLIPVFGLYIGLSILFQKGTQGPNNFGERFGNGASTARRVGIWSVLIVLVFSISIGIMYLLYGQQDNPVKSAHKRKVTLRYASGRLKERYTIIDFQNGDRELDGRYTFWYFNGQVAVNCYYDHYRLTLDSISCSELSMQAIGDAGRNGLWQSWYKDGKKRGEHYYKNGKLDGQLLKW